jgi:type IV secretory pathway ATPase VirB11/archaellum biosynthesis ATPase
MQRPGFKQVISDATLFATFGFAYRLNIFRLIVDEVEREQSYALLGSASGRQF